MEPKHLGAFGDRTGCLGASPGSVGQTAKPAPRAEPPPQGQALPESRSSHVCRLRTPGRPRSPRACCLPCEPRSCTRTGLQAVMGYGNAQDTEMPGAWVCTGHGNEWQHGNDGTREHTGTHGNTGPLGRPQQGVRLRAGASSGSGCGQWGGVGQIEVLLRAAPWIAVTARRAAPACSQALLSHGSRLRADEKQDGRRRAPGLVLRSAASLGHRQGHAGRPGLATRLCSRHQPIPGESAWASRAVGSTGVPLPPPLLIPRLQMSAPLAALLPVRRPVSLRSRGRCSCTG